MGNSSSNPVDNAAGDSNEYAEKQENDFCRNKLK
jgi:hypothetical protein